MATTTHIHPAPILTPVTPQPPGSNWAIVKDKASQAVEAGKHFCKAGYRHASDLLSRVHDFVVNSALPKFKEAGHFIAAQFGRAVNFVSVHREQALFLAIGIAVGALVACAVQHYFFNESGRAPTVAAQSISRPVQLPTAQPVATTATTTTTSTSSSSSAPTGTTTVAVEEKVEFKEETKEVKT